MANWKTYTSISAAKKSGSIYYKDKNGKKMLAVTKPQLDAWKKRNKGQFKGNALTAWANAKGKTLRVLALLVLYVLSLDIIRTQQSQERQGFHQ